MSVTWARIRRVLKPFDLQTLLFVFVFITVLFLVVYPIILVVLNSFQSAPPGRPRDRRHGAPRPAPYSKPRAVIWASADVRSGRLARGCIRAGHA